MQRRNTAQRELVLRAVKELKNHPTAEEILAEVRKSAPSVSMGTVYRNLKILAEEGLVLKIEAAGESDRFDHSVGEHCHLRCVICGKLRDLELDVIPTLEECAKASGLDLLGCDVVFRGICPDCKKKN